MREKMRTRLAAQEEAERSAKQSTVEKAATFLEKFYEVGPSPPSRLLRWPVAAFILLNPLGRVTKQVPMWREALEFPWECYGMGQERCRLMVNAGRCAVASDQFLFCAKCPPPSGSRAAGSCKFFLLALQPRTVLQ